MPLRRAGDDGDAAGEIEADVWFMRAGRRSSQMPMPCAFSSRSSASSSRMRASLSVDAVRAQALQVDRLEAAHQRRVPAGRRGGGARASATIASSCAEQQGAEARHVADAAVVRE